MVKLSVTGLKEIDKVLRELPLQLTHNVLAQAHTAAAKPLVDRAKLLAPEGPTGNLVDSIGTERLPRGSAEIGQVQAGPRRSRKHRGHAGHMVEYGTKKRANKSGANRGVMSKQPFMRPAFEATKTQVEGSIAEQIGRKLFNFMKRTLKQ
jgi:HK97 gp10 family phage protein